MHCNVQILIWFLTPNLYHILTSASLQASQARDQGTAIFVYPKHVYSERDLSECPANTACSVIYRRYWLPPIVERHCRCPTARECEWSWSKNHDNRTLALDNRTQLKFCTNLHKMPICSSTETSLKLDSDTLHHTTSKPRSTRAKLSRVSDARTATALCYCPDHHRWEQLSESPDNFRCAQLKACLKSEVCGFIRTDLYSTSYLCSCPIGQQCVTQNKQTHYQQLLFYTGPVYTAHCTPVSD